MGDDGHIKTQIDAILENLRKNAGKQMSVRSLASLCGMPERSVLEWLFVLEKNHQVQITNRIRGIYVSWTGPAFEERKQPQTSGAVYAGEESALSVARQNEIYAKREALSPKRHTIRQLESEQQVSRIESMIEELREKQKEIDEGKKQEVEEELRKLEEKIREEEAGQERKEAVQRGMELNEDADEEMRKTEDDTGKEAIEHETRSEIDLQDDEARKEAIRRKMNIPKSEVEGEIEEESGDEGKEAIRNESPFSEEIEGKKAIHSGIIKDSHKAIGQIDGELRKLEADMKNERAAAEERASEEKEAKEKAAREAREAEEKEAAEDGAEKEASLSYVTPAFRRARKKMEKLRKPVPVEVTGVSIQFSEKLNRQMKRIANQVAQINALRAEKARFLTEQYMPLQRKLESELETIGDRVAHVEKGIVGLQDRASELPSQVANVEKLQVSSVKAHSEMRRAYDEATALMEESTRELADERGRMEEMVEQSRHEIAGHKAKAEELGKTLSELDALESHAGDRVISARAALAEQAERLASAEKYSQELTSLKDEITENVSSIKREITTAKTILTNIQKQMEQMRQIEIWSDSIAEEYEKRMGEIGDYVKFGNEEFETLRESVEANFVRKYLRELRQLTESYTFELGQAKSAETDLDTLIGAEKNKLDSLIEGARNLSYAYETQSKAPEGADKFKEHRQEFEAMQETSQKRTEVEQMIAQIVGGKAEYQPKISEALPKKGKGPRGKTKVRKVAAAKKAKVQKITKAKPAKAVKAPKKAKEKTKAQEKKAPEKTKAHKKSKKAKKR